MDFKKFAQPQKSQKSKPKQCVNFAFKAAEYFQLDDEPFIKIFAVDPSYLRKEGQEPPTSFDYGDKLLNRIFYLDLNFKQSFFLFLILFFPKQT